MKSIKGPWEADIRRDSKDSLGLDLFVNEIHILGPVKSDGWQVNIAQVRAKPGHGGTEEQGIANAHLIAAAPEMFEALEKLLSHCAHIQQIPMHTVLKARSAISKAKGEI